MEKLKEMGVDPEFVKKVAAKVKAIMAKHAEISQDPEKIAYYLEKEYHLIPANSGVDMKAIAAKVKTIIAKVKSGEIDVSKFM